MELREMLKFVKDNNVYIGLSYTGQQDYATTTKTEILKNNDLLDKKVISINAFKIKDRRVIGIKIKEG